MKVEINNITYEIIKDYKEGYNEEEFKQKCTDYFYDYDYIVGDIAYGKLRLKGFYDEKNKKANKINNYKNLDNYLKINCAPDCKYFIAKKTSK
ncbi:MAG: DUF1027 domain-containing protein [Mycoplasmatota bacterium]|nr:DUF1027 domain-containing protein [Mycoplasmatota bacterium]